MNNDNTDNLDHDQTEEEAAPARSRMTRWKLSPARPHQGLQLSFRLRIASVAPLSHGNRCR